MRKSSDIKPLIIYTMTSGLGDFLVMTDLVSKIESLMPEARCIIVHRNNPHISLWQHDTAIERFFNLYNPSRLLALILALKKARSLGYTLFGLQMAPGSLQGFFFHSLLKKIGCLDFIADFNLINADIITPSKGNYLLDIHLNQIAKLFQVTIPPHSYKLRLPFDVPEDKPRKSGSRLIGVHPWSRRGAYPSYVWPFEKWAETINYLLQEETNSVVIFGKDGRFEEFRLFLRHALKNGFSRVAFEPSKSVQGLAATISGLDCLISVNTSVVHIGYALDKKMVILSGPSLDLWTPKGNGIKIITDDEACFAGADKPTNDTRMSAVSRIRVENVIRSVDELIV